MSGLRGLSSIYHIQTVPIVNLSFLWDNPGAWSLSGILGVRTIYNSQRHFSPNHTTSQVATGLNGTTTYGVIATDKGDAQRALRHQVLGVFTTPYPSTESEWSTTRNDQYLWDER